jgi:hypothetical protein
VKEGRCVEIHSRARYHSNSCSSSRDGPNEPIKRVEVRQDRIIGAPHLLYNPSAAGVILVVSYFTSYSVFLQSYILHILLG